MLEPLPIRFEAFFSRMAAGERFCLAYFPPDGVQGKGGILYLHPFGEEMNKSRRTVAVAARELAARGWTVLQIDLAGCGDSSGDFGDASWETWLADARFAIDWLAQRAPGTLWLWGLRVGCLLATSALPASCQANLLLWQPVLSGRQYLTQFLRMRSAAGVIGGGESVGTKALRTQLASGAAVEVAGYVLAPSLGAALEAAELDLPACAGRILWCEVQIGEDSHLTPAAQARVASWRERGHPVHATAVQGLPFWQTQEIVQCDALIGRTMELMEETS